MSRYPVLLPLAVIVLGVGCVNAPDLAAPIASEPARVFTSTTQASGPHFLRPSAGAPPLATTSVSFWAVKGKSRDGRIFYRSGSGSGSGSSGSGSSGSGSGSGSGEFLRFIVPSNSLLRYPNGKLFAKDDSVRITITVVDQANLIADFQPSGLKFSANDPAELRIWFGKTDNDLDRDGDVDQVDQSFERQLGIWKRDSATAPWIKLGSGIDISDDRIRARVIVSFTNYAIAY